MKNLTKSCFLELVNKSKMVYAKETSFNHTNKSEYLELSNYEIILEQQIFYQNRSQYVNLIKDYIDGKINCYVFQWDFFELYQNHLEILDDLIENSNQYSSITFYTDSKIKHVSSLINDMVGFCEFLDEGVTEERFDEEIKKIYNDLQKYASLTLTIHYEIK